MSGARKARLAPGSLRDTAWQIAEYQRQLGVEAAERQVKAAKQARNACVCQRRTLKTEFGFRTVHERDCPKWKPWMAEFAPATPGANVRAAAFIASARPGRFSGANPTATEQASGEAVEAEDEGPLKPGRVGHRVLAVYRDGRRRTAYDASYESLAAEGKADFHGRRRETPRLAARGLLIKDGTLPNRAVNGRDHVDAYRICENGRVELQRLDLLLSGDASKLARP